jgi:hypothetical protein
LTGAATSITILENLNSRPLNPIGKTMARHSIRNGLSLSATCLLILLLAGCRNAEAPVDAGGESNTTAASAQRTRDKPTKPPALETSTEVAGPLHEVLSFAPAQATAIVMKDHRALRELGVPFLVEAGTGRDGRWYSSFAEKEVDLSAVAMLRSRDDSEAVVCVKLAPGATVQRLINAWKLERDEKLIPGFISYRTPVEKDRSGEEEMFRSREEMRRSLFVVERGGALAFGAEKTLKQRLAPGAAAGPLAKRIESLAADNDLIFCCLTDYQGLEILAPYLKPLLPIIEYWFPDPRVLPAGAFSSVTIALRVKSEPRLLGRLEAADESLAAEIVDLFERHNERLRREFAAAREFVMKAFPAHGADEIHRFLATAIQGMSVRSRGRVVDVTLPLGSDGAELKRFAELASLVDVRKFENAFSDAREAARLTRPEEQLKTIAIGIHNHHDVYQRFPSDVLSKEGKPLLSWRVQVLPFVEEGKIWEKFKLDEPWDSEHNRALLNEMPAVYRDARGNDPTRTTFQIFAGENTPFHGERAGLNKVIDGASNTLMVIQTPLALAAPWTKPADIAYEPANPLGSFGKPPKEEIWAAMCDGRVHLFPPDYSGEHWRWLIERNDRHPVDLPDPSRTFSRQRSGADDFGDFEQLE